SHARDGAAGLRSAAVPDEELWRVIEDPTAPMDARAGAAAAIGRDLDEAGRTRLRVAAAACAAPKLRVALSAVADEEEIEGAFAENRRQALISRAACRDREGARWIGQPPRPS